jgi:hypothetical protein
MKNGSGPMEMDVPESHTSRISDRRSLINGKELVEVDRQMWI